MSPSSSPCRVCGAASRPLWQAALLGRQVQYFMCDHCRYLQTEQPTWLEEAYAVSINRSDTGILVRNRECAERVLITLWQLGGLDRRVTDVAGGYGLLVRMLRDEGVDAYWSDRYSENLVARGFEDRGGPCVLATAFEALEHFEQPLEELARLASAAESVLVSTQLAPTETPAARDWWYYGLEHGQHIGFFRRETLEHMAGKLGLRLLSDGRAFHLFTHAGLGERCWRLAMRHRRHLLRFARRHLEPRTQRDFEALSRPPGGPL